MGIVQTADAVAATGSVPPAAAPPANAQKGGLTFREFLSDINPLQYIPVVGAIYRAATGDEGNATLRFVASLGTSFALGGPLGVGITVAEKVTGIDPETIGRKLLGKLFHHDAAPAAVGTLVASTGPPAPSDAGADARPWTATELSAYGVKNSLSGELSAGTVTGADVLNTLELHRLSRTLV